MEPPEKDLKQKKYRKIRDLILEIYSAVDAAVVDGAHDRKTLKHLGFDAPVFTRSELSYVDLADLIAKKFSTVAILTDFDEEGKRANETLNRLFEQRQIKVCHSCRENLEALLKQEKITTIEGIYSLIVK
jgi:5S rRNA maturation endonuclease (ribonuclease M5)